MKKINFLKINLMISKYLLFALPVIIVTGIWAMIVLNGNADFSSDSLTLKILWEILGWHFMFWFLCLLYFLVVLILSSSFREVILSKVTRSEEHDERESYIAGRASKSTFLLTLAILIVFFFLSGIQISFYQPSSQERIKGTKGRISIAYKLEILEEKEIIKIEKIKGTSIDFKGIPLSKEAIILMIIFLHIGGYHVFARKQIM